MYTPSATKRATLAVVLSIGCLTPPPPVEQDPEVIQAKARIAVATAEEDAGRADPIPGAAHVAPWPQVEIICKDRRLRAAKNAVAEGQARLDWTLERTPLEYGVYTVEKHRWLIRSDIVVDEWTAWKVCLAENGWRIVRVR